MFHNDARTRILVDLSIVPYFHHPYGSCQCNQQCFGQCAVWGSAALSTAAFVAMAFGRLLLLLWLGLAGAVSKDDTSSITPESQ